MVFDLVLFNGILGSFGALVSNSKTASHIEDTSNTYMGYIWPCRIQGHFGGHLVHLSQSGLYVENGWS